MTPKLLVLAGPLAGRIFEIDEEPYSLGREASNHLQIREASVSRQHCVIRYRDGQWLLEDRESRHGTFVNGARVTEHALEHGDYLKISGTLLRFHSREDAATDDVVLRLDEGDFQAESTIQIPTGEGRELQVSKLLASLQPAARAERHLEALLEISTSIQTLRSVEQLAQRLMELMSKVIPAQRTAVLLMARGDVAFEAGYTADQQGEEMPAFQLSRTTAEQVMRKQVALLCNDVLHDEAFDRAKSLHSARIETLICVPLLLPGRSLGVLYADTCNPEARFNEGHLRLMTAVAAIAAGAFDNARHLEWLEQENQRLRAAELNHDMVGDSPPMRDVYRFISRVAPTDSTVLIRGESGTGKELAARAIHSNSPRADRPFVALNCAVLSEALLESELFGHEKGAFTGAVGRKLGKFEVADSGTLFLDEVGEIPLALQAKLLRVLEEHSFERIGGNNEIQVDIRIIAATNRDLKTAIEEQRFREDLYYRLDVISLDMPPLRERGEDITQLARHFATLYGQKVHRPIAGLSPEVERYLTGYDWPGNVRELSNAIERAVVLGQSDLIHPENLPEAVLETRSDSGSGPTSFHEAVRKAKRQIVREALAAGGGSFAKAAKLLELNRNYLHRLVKNLGLRD